jgi:glutaminyl-tRNA synthetase
MDNKWSRVMQLDEAIAFLKEQLAAVGDKYEIDQAAFEKASGVGINVTDEDIDNLVKDAFKLHEKEINELKYDFQFNKLLYHIKDKNKWADSKVVMAKLKDA